MDSVKAEVLIGKRLNKQCFYTQRVRKFPHGAIGYVLKKLTPRSERRKPSYRLPGNARLQPGTAPFPFLRTPHQPCLHGVIMDILSGRVKVPFIAYEAVPVLAMPDPVHGV
jgi:hypothetical protein